MYHFNACANSPPTRLQFELYLTPWFTALYVHPTSCHFDYHFKAFFTSARTSLPSAAVCASSTTPLTVFSSSLHHPLPSPTPLTHSPHALPSHPLPSHNPHTPLHCYHTPLTLSTLLIVVLPFSHHHYRRSLRVSFMYTCQSDMYGVCFFRCFCITHNPDQSHNLIFKQSLS